jgi:putative two-component system response regulator
MAIADVYDALVSHRPYKRAYAPEEAADIILKGRGAHFDPLLVDVFAKITDQFEAIVDEIGPM